jgi:serine/threonine protein kinase
MTPERLRQIEDLYRAARKCHPYERAVLVECTDPEIRSRVERMLAVESGGQILDQSPEGFLTDPTLPAVALGAQLGPYSIEAQIGAGGMGTVYRAIDKRLGRVVAIKTVSELYSERSQLEARAISSLNHPHVCTLYDVGPNYLVMEFIEGSTLAEEIKKGPLDPVMAARYGAQIAGALAEAHALGIVHRDLKPSNVMVTRHGAKVLDFGLAKTSEEEHPRSEIAITQTGVVEGTPAYMAPEQVEGKEPGGSADLFSLGVMLFEMLAGHLPFPGASLGQMLSSGAQPLIPTPSRQRTGIPLALDTLVSKLLEKDPARRPQSAAEVARALSSIAVPSERPRMLLVYAAVPIALLLGLGVIFYLRSSAPSPQPRLPNPASYTQLTSFTDSAVDPVLSPDGRMVAFFRSARRFETAGEIWLKPLPDGESIQMTHDSREKYNIAFSPDSARIAYSVFPTTSNLFDTYTVSARGGDSELFLPNSAGLSWLDDGHLLFSQIKGSGIHMGIVTSNSDRSALREIYFPSLDRGMAHYSYPSPDRKWILLEEMNPSWQPCRVVPFSGGSLGRQVGPPGATCTSAAWSRDGKYMYLGVQVAGRYHLWRQRFPDGQPEQLTFGPSDEFGIAMAPDGKSLITSIATSQNAVWFHDTQGDRALSTEGYADSAVPLFSRDGQRLYYLMRRNSPASPAELWRADLTSRKSEVMVPGVSMDEFDISPDEKQVVFFDEPSDRQSELWIASLDRSSPPRRIGTSGDTPHFGRDGKVFFRMSEGRDLYIGVTEGDGTARRKALPFRIIDLGNSSPDGCCIVADAELPNLTVPPTLLLPLDGSPAIRICETLCAPVWSQDGRYLYLQIADVSGQNLNARTAVIPLGPGKVLPRLTPELVHDPAGWAKIPGVKVLDGVNIAPGPNPSVYAYIKSSNQANLYRIPLN